MPTLTVRHAERAGQLLATVFGDTHTAYDVGPALTCSEADAIASALHTLGQTSAAILILCGHALGDEDATKVDTGDVHSHLVRHDSTADEIAAFAYLKTHLEA